MCVSSHSTDSRTATLEAKRRQQINIAADTAISSDAYRPRKGSSRYRIFIEITARKDAMCLGYEEGKPHAFPIGGHEHAVPPTRLRRMRQPELR